MWEIHTSGVRTGWGSPPPYSTDFTPLRYAFLNIDRFSNVAKKNAL